MRFLFCYFLILASSLAWAEGENQGEADIQIVLDLAAQKATLYMDGDAIYTSPISSGRKSHPTPVGDFEVIEKDPNHKSTLYGKIVDSHGGIVKSSADIATPVPKGCRFEQAPMKFFLRFDGAAGTHAGILPGYPASHGCVRMPPGKAKLFYDIAQIGTPVHVYGTPPYRSEEDEAKSHPKSEPKAEHVASAPQSATPSATPPKKPFFMRLF